MDVEIYSNSVERTIELGRRFGKCLRGGEVVAITGQLGSGKTHFIKGVADQVCRLNGQKLVSSPTFVLVNEYRGRLDLYHIDAYRLDSWQQLEAIGIDDYFYPESVVLIEWADKVSQALEKIECIELNITHESENCRHLVFRNLPAYCTDLAD